MQAMVTNEGALLDPVVSARVALMRLATGLLQGLFLYTLYGVATWPGAPVWPATDPYLFGPLLFMAFLAPVLFISSLGHMKAALVAAWISAALLIMMGLAHHDIWRGSASSDGGGMWFLGYANDHGRYPSATLFLYGAVGFFIAHTLVQAAVLQGRCIAAYDNYFELAWKLALQILLSLFFVGVMWFLLMLGVQLFHLAGLDFLVELLMAPWFAIPVSCAAFSGSMHLTDVRPAIVRGIRGLLLLLMSWILPLITLLVAGCLLSLPITGLARWWSADGGVALPLAADMVLVFLINAAFQNGAAGQGAPRLVRLSARLAAVLLVPLTAIAVHALYVRVDGHGWTSERIGAACYLLVAACYACGYAWAACRRGAWLAPLARVNVVTAFLILAILLALFTPLADPARLSVDNQMARFAAGKSTAQDLDVNYLRFKGVRYGRAALQQLQAGAQGPDAALLHERTTHVLALKNGWESPDLDKEGPVDLAVNLEVLPAGARLPPSFLRMRWADKPASARWPNCLTIRGERCEAFVLGPDADGRAQVMLLGDLEHVVGGVVLLAETADGHWRRVGQFPYALVHCEAFKRQLAAGQFSWIAPQTRDLQMNGARLRMVPEPEPDHDTTLCNAHQQ